MTEQIINKKVVATEKAPKAIGPYSQAIIFEQLVFTAGQLGINPETGELAETVEAQTKQAMENLKHILEEAGSSFDCVLKTTIYLADMNDFAKVNEIYASYFPENPPARSTIQVAALPKHAKVEIDMIAAMPIIVPTSDKDASIA